MRQIAPMEDIVRLKMSILVDNMYTLLVRFMRVVISIFILLLIGLIFAMIILSFMGKIS